jgi:hypothetical protein
MYYNDLINGGCYHMKGKSIPTCGVLANPELATKRCKEIQADTALEFMAFALCPGCAVLSFWP